MCQQWRFQHSGSTRAFIYALYCRSQACTLCMFVLPPTSLIKIVNSGSFHWALSMFIYFCFMLAFRVQFASDVNQKISFVATVLSNTFARSLLGFIHWSPSLPCHITLIVFEALCLHKTLNLNSNPMDSTHSRIISNQR